MALLVFGSCLVIDNNNNDEDRVIKRRIPQRHESFRLENEFLPDTSYFI